MRGVKDTYENPKKLLWRILLAFSFILAISWSVLADARIGSLKVRGLDACYCRCERAKGVRDCIKMCELPKYASRWWAISCNKPRGHASHDNPGAGPHLKHRDRAERARL